MKQRGPWKITSSEVKYKNPWMEVIEDKVIQPNGEAGLYGTFKIGSGAATLAFDGEGFVYLTREFHYGVGIETIEGAVGGMHNGETPLEAAKRELKEELGITASHWTQLGFVESLTSYVKCPVHLFLARQLKFTSPTLDGTETIKPLKVKFETAVEMVMNNEIIAAQTCVLILKAKEYLKKSKS